MQTHLWNTLDAHLVLDRTSSASDHVTPIMVSLASEDGRYSLDDLAPYVNVLRYDGASEQGCILRSLYLRDGVYDLDDLRRVLRRRIPESQ